jgi:hypothetical protein
MTLSNFVWTDLSRIDHVGDAAHDSVCLARARPGDHDDGARFRHHGAALRLRQPAQELRFGALGDRAAQTALSALEIAREEGVSLQIEVGTQILRALFSRQHGILAHQVYQGDLVLMLTSRAAEIEVAGPLGRIDADFERGLEHDGGIAQVPRPDVMQEQASVDDLVELLGVKQVAAALDETVHVEREEQIAPASPDERCVDVLQEEGARAHQPPQSLTGEHEAPFEVHGKASRPDLVEAQQGEPSQGPEQAKHLVRTNAAGQLPAEREGRAPHMQDGALVQVFPAVEQSAGELEAPRHQLAGRPGNPSREGHLKCQILPNQAQLEQPVELPEGCPGLDPRGLGDVEDADPFRTCRFVQELEHAQARA